MNKRLLMYAVFGEEQDFVPSDDKIEEVLAMLAPRERFVIERRFAVNRMTLKAIGQELPRRDGGIGVCRETARAVEAKALRKLRHPRRSRILWPDWYLHR